MLPASAFAVLALLGAVAHAAPAKRDVDTTYPYTGPAIPVGDVVNPSVDNGGKGNGKGYPRLWEHPAVYPAPGAYPTNNINVISSAYFPGGINIHFQTPFGIGANPVVQYGSSKNKLDQTATGFTHT